MLLKQIQYSLINQTVTQIEKRKSDRLLDRFTIWNVEIVTVRKAFWDPAYELAYQRTAVMLTPEEHSAESVMEFEPAEFSNTGKVLSYRN